MDRDLARLTRVLRQVAHDAGLALLHRSDPAAIRHCIAQYNRVRARLGELDATYTTVFGPLPEQAHPGDVRILARALACYAEAQHRTQWELASLFEEWLSWLCPARYVTLDFC